MISNVIFDDWRLSYKEIGIYCFMMKFPENWDFSLRNLASSHRESRDAVKAGVDRLLHYGYISRHEQSRKGKGRFGSYEYIIYEDPNDNPHFIPCPSRDSKQFDSSSSIKDNSFISETDLENPCTVKPCTENPYADNPYTVKPCTGHPTTSKTVFNNTVFNNTFEEEEVYRARVDTDSFRDKMMNPFMNLFFSNSCNESAQAEIVHAFNAIMNALPDIRNKKSIEVINTCTKEQAEQLFHMVYRDLFCTCTGQVLRSDIKDKHAYLVKVIPSQLGASYGPNPLDSWGIRS